MSNSETPIILNLGFNNDEDKQTLKTITELFLNNEDD